MGSLLRTLPTRELTGHAFISSAGKGRSKSTGNWAGSAGPAIVRNPACGEGGHAIVKWLHQCVGIGSDDGVGLERFTGGFVFPRLPEAGEGEEGTILQGDGVGLFCFRVELLPLVKPVGGDEAASALHGFAKGGACGDGFGFGVDGGVGDLRILRPEGNEAPAEDGEFSLAGFGRRCARWAAGFGAPR